MEKCSGVMYSSVFELINTIALISSDILLDKNTQYSRMYIKVNHTRRDTYFYFIKHRFSSLFNQKIPFSFISILKKLKQVAIYNKCMTKRVFFNLKKTFNKYKFKRFLSGIDYLKSISKIWRI